MAENLTSENLPLWLQSESAIRFFAQEREAFGDIASLLCGQMGVQLSLNARSRYLEQLNLSSRFYVCQTESEIGGRVSEVENQHEKGQGGNSILVDFDALPFDNNQFSVVIAPQMNLFCHDTHAALREIYRITASDGFIAISGINAFSLMGLQSKILPKKYPLLPTVSLGQLKTWLSLLGCDIVSGKLFHYSAMQNHATYPKLSEKMENIGDRWLPMLAGGYWLIARKRVIGNVIRGSKSFKPRKNAKMSHQVAKRY